MFCFRLNVELPKNSSSIHTLTIAKCSEFSGKFHRVTESEAHPAYLVFAILPTEKLRRANHAY